MKNARPLIVRRLLELGVDAVLVVAAFVLAYVTRIGQFDSTAFPFAPYFHLALLFVPVFLALAAWFGAYRLREASLGELFRICLNTSLVGALLFPLVFFFNREIFFSRLILIYIGLYATLFLFVFHAGTRRFAARRHRSGQGILRTLLIGNGRAAERIIARLRADGSRFQAVAALAPFGGGNNEISGIPVLGKLDALERVSDTERIDAIIQTEAAEQTINLLAYAEGKYLEFLLAPEVLGAFRRNLSSEEIAGMAFLRHRISPLFGWGQFWKRLLDILVAALLLVLGSPLFLFGRLRHEQCARDPHNGVFLKFEFSNFGGPLKWFPEFLNVFKGEMSLVGPRPRSPVERQKLRLHERRRLVIKPGIFGPWQLCRLRGDHPDPESEIALDIEYIFHWSFWGDLQLLGQSFLSVLRNFRL